MTELQRKKLKQSLMWVFVVFIVVGFLFGLVNNIAKWIFVVPVILGGSLAALLFIFWTIFYLFYFWYLDFRIRGLYSSEDYDLIKIANSKFSIFYEINIESKDAEDKFESFKHVYEDICPNTFFGKLYMKYENLGKE